MSKNVIHNFDILIQNSADVKSAEHLTDIMIKELAKISKEMSQQKDIEQLWQEQKSQNTSVNNANFSAEGGVNDMSAKTALSVNNTPSVFGEVGQTFNNVSKLSGTTPFGMTNFNTSIGEGVDDTIDSTMMSSVLSANTTSPIFGVEDDALNLNKDLTNHIYSGVEAQQMLTIPEKLQTNGEPTLDVVKEAIRKKLELAATANDMAAVEYWTKISKAFDEDKGASVQDFDGKPNHVLFTEMYAALKQLNSVAATKNFKWEIVLEKMLKAIDANILLGEISEGSKKRWKIIQQELQKDTPNIANLFEQYNELFLLLRQVEGLDDLPGTITITTKTKIYPNLSADRLYAEIGKESVYAFLKEISSEDVRGSAVYRNAVKIKDTNAISFIVGESLDFFLDESLINQNLYKKEHINWIVYKKRKGKKDEETIFEDEGTSFSYNFDAEGAYIIEAYGQEHGANKKKSKKSFAFVEVKIVAQELVILPPSTVKGGLVRPSAKEFLFKTALKQPKIKTLNPLKFYYQIETKINNKGTSISEEKELDSTGSIRLLMPDLGTYKIKVISKDQYALKQEFEVSVIRNEVTSIGPAQGESNKNVFLLGGSNKTFTLEAKTFKIPPTDEEKEGVKWVIYDANTKLYIPSGDEIMYKDKKNFKKPYLNEWSSFTGHIPQEEGHYTVEAYSDTPKGANAKATFKMEVQRPQVTEAYWAYSNGDKKETSGFSGEVNHVKAKIPGYDNQKVRISFYLNGSKEPSYYNDTTTDGSGEINKVITFDDTFQRRFGVQEGKTTKISFKLMGIQNNRLYPFKKNASVNMAVLNVATGANITDAYFQYDRKRVTAQDEIPLSYSGEYVTIVAKTQNMIGKEIVLTYHKASKEPNFRSKVKIDSEGTASVTFKITRLKGAKIGEKMSYYVGIEGHSTIHLGYKGLNMVVEDVIKETFDNNNLQLIWGGKVSVEFRKKVVQICKELWGEQQKYIMANALMIAMSVETGETFSSSVIRKVNGKYVAFSKEEHKSNPDLVNKKAVGLGQFTIAAVKSLILNERGISENTKTAAAITLREVNEYKQKLALLSPEKQLDYIKTYLMLFNNHKKVKRPEDVYMIIFAPRATGKGDNVDLYKKYLTDADEKNEKVNEKYKDNAPMDTKNDGFNKGNKDGIIQSGELLARYREMRTKGMRYNIDINEARKLNQVLAEKIIKEGRVTFANSHVSKVIDKAMAQDNINDTAIGRNSKRSSYGRALGGETELVSELLYIMYQLTKDYTFNVSEISGADHSVNSKHYFGRAFDINEINGKDIGYGIGKKAVCLIDDNLISKFEKKALNYGASRVLNSLNDLRKREHHNHFHVEVE